MGTLARCATAFGVAEVLLVGERAYNTFGSHGAADFVTFRHFHCLEEARSRLAACRPRRARAALCGGRPAPPEPRPPCEWAGEALPG